MYVKEFDKWNAIKKRVQLEKRDIYVRAGEVRWCAIGVNVGSEIDGKGDSFTRPVLVLHVIGAKLALVVPMTTKVKKVAGYMPFIFQDKDHALCVHQIKIVSSKRLLTRKGKITSNRLESIKKTIQEVYRF